MSNTDPTKKNREWIDVVTEGNMFDRSTTFDSVYNCDPTV